MLLANGDIPAPVSRDLPEFTEEEAREFFEARRWPHGPRCVHCGGSSVARLQGVASRPGLFRCRSCDQQFTVTIGTMFENSHISLRIWAQAIHLLAGSREGLNARQLQRRLGLNTYRTAWLLCRRLREAMRCAPLARKLSRAAAGDDESIHSISSPRHRLMRRLGAMRARLSAYQIRDAPDYAEVLIAEVLGGRRVASPVTQGHDVIAPGYGRVEVKCRQLPFDGRSEQRVQILPSKEHGFDFLAIIVFYSDFAVKGAVLAPYRAVWDLAAAHKFNRISYSRTRRLPGAFDLTQAVRTAIEA